LHTSNRNCNTKALGKVFKLSENIKSPQALLDRLGQFRVHRNKNLIVLQKFLKKKGQRLLAKRISNINNNVFGSSWEWRNEERDVKIRKNKELAQHKMNKSMVKMDQKGILAREYRRADYQSHANLHFRSFPAASFPLCKYSRTGLLYVTCMYIQPFSFIFSFLFLWEMLDCIENVRRLLN